jgi:hypothetical protein
MKHTTCRLITNTLAHNLVVLEGCSKMLLQRYCNSLIDVAKHFYNKYFHPPKITSERPKDAYFQVDYYGNFLANFDG